MRISDWSSDVCSSDLLCCWPLLPTRLPTSPPPTSQQQQLLRPDRCQARRTSSPCVSALSDCTFRGIRNRQKPLPSVEPASKQESKLPHSRSEERRVGKECVSTFGSRWWQNQ